MIWHGAQLYQPDWGSKSHVISFTLCDAQEAGEFLHIILNAYWEPLTFQLPDLQDGKLWHRIVDTSIPGS